MKIPVTASPQPKECWIVRGTTSDGRVFMSRRSPWLDDMTIQQCQDWAIKTVHRMNNDDANVSAIKQRMNSAMLWEDVE
jgi:hypothetical protein